MKKIANLIIAIAFFSVYATAQTAPKYEVRAAWLTTIGGLDWPHSYSQSSYSAIKQQKEFCDILDRLKKANVNTVMLQTRIRGTVIYPSDIEPWDGCLSGFPGRSPGYDALKFAIDECHKRGIELHAWVVAIPVGKWNFLGCSKLRRRYPKLIRNIDGEGYMNPESETTAEYIADICAEIARNYDVDGIHLDYIRYPETWKIKVPLEEGRRYITRIVKKVHDAVKSIRPWVKMSCSPVGKYDDLSRYWSHGWNAKNTVCQDAQSWLKDGLMDELFPMMYFQGDQFYPFALDWKEQSDGKIVTPGLGVYFLDSSQKDWPLDIVSREMYVLRQFGMGHAYFRSRFFTDNTKGIYDFASDEFDIYPSLVPPMTWASTRRPSSPTGLTITRSNDKDIITWNDIHDTYYNTYASDCYPVDINDAKNLIAVRRPSNHIEVPVEPDGQFLNYAITAMDRYGNESKPASTAEEIQRTSTKMLANNGQTLRIPVKPTVLDADYVIIQSIAGNIITTEPYKSINIDIKDIADGVYTISSLNKKGYTHRLGMFIIKR